MRKAQLDIDYIGKLFTVALFLVLSVAGFGFSIYLFLVSNSLFLYAIAICFLFLSIISGFFNILASYWYYKSFGYEKYIEELKSKLKPMGRLPTVSVVMPSHDEDLDMIKRNAKELTGIRYPKGKLNVFLLNDSADKDRKRELERFCKSSGINFIYRKRNTDYKAGALNHFLERSRDEFVAVFDCDEHLEDRNFLMDVLPYFQDEKIAYVQTEKRYSKGTFFSDTVDIFDAFFFKFIETARAMDNTAIFSGSCGVIRRSVIDEVGGFPKYAIEDTFFSLESDLKGYRGFYLPKVYAYGKPIYTFSQLVKQQWRYNYGDTQFVSYFLRKKEFKKQQMLAKLNYMAHGFGLNYLSVVLILFTIVSTAIVFSTLPFAHIGIIPRFTSWSDITLSVARVSALEIAELLGLFAFILSMFAPAILTKIYFKSFKKGVMVFLLNYALAVVRAKAAIAAIFNLKDRLKWNSKSEEMGSAVSAMAKARTELVFVAVLAVLGIVALMELKISGGIWLMWYAGMYSLTPLFFYKYG
ncbi:MAG: glycosyltransferase [Candidatus Micrarchaeota archaeon]|nr:glycosyltransferase [Candidatus Micrarchaeota archaeon]